MHMASKGQAFQREVCLSTGTHRIHFLQTREPPLKKDLARKQQELEAYQQNASAAFKMSKFGKCKALR